MLRTFSYEIFLSYGWAGNRGADQGSRAWASQLRKWLQDDIGINLSRPRIYFDDAEPRIGPIPDWLYPAIEQSALLVFLVSPGSCLPKSWCQKEVTHFWDNARSLTDGKEEAPPEHRIFKVMQSGLSGDGLVDPLSRWQLPSFDLCDSVDTVNGAAVQAGNLSNPSLSVAAALKALSANLRTALERVARLEQDSSSGRRVFLSSPFSKSEAARFLALRRNLLRDGHQVRSATPLPPEAETEAEYCQRIELALDGDKPEERSSLGVCLIPEPLPATGWSRNDAAWQFRKAIRKSAQGNFNSCFWYDPDRNLFDAQCVQELKAGLAAGDCVMQGEAFGFFKEYVRNRLRSGDLPETQRLSNAPDREEIPSAPGTRKPPTDEEANMLMSDLATLTVRSGKISQTAGRIALCYRIGVNPGTVNTEGVPADFAELLTHSLYETGNTAGIIRLCDTLAPVLRGGLAVQLKDIRATFDV